MSPEKQAKNRDDKGRFLKGESGNPAGRPPGPFSITEMLRTKVAEKPDVILRLVALCESEDENVALRALIALTNRLEGLPKGAVDLSGGVKVLIQEYDGFDPRTIG